MLDLKRMGAGRRLLHQASLLNGSGVEHLKRLSQSEIQKLQKNSHYRPSRSTAPSSRKTP